jgi:hypothetical protein
MDIVQAVVEELEEMWRRLGDEEQARKFENEIRAVLGAMDGDRRNICMILMHLSRQVAGLESREDVILENDVNQSC